MTYKIKFFKASKFPRAYIKQILNDENWVRMCQGNVQYEDYAKNALDSAEIIGVVLSERKSEHLKTLKVYGFLIALTSDFKTTLDGKEKPVCKDHEWYLDVICISPEKKGAGKALLNAFYKKAKKSGKTAIRLYAVAKSVPYWENKQGFLPCENPCEGSECYPKRYSEDYYQGVRMTKCLLT